MSIMIGLIKVCPFQVCRLMSLLTAFGLCNSIVNVQHVLDPYRKKAEAAAFAAASHPTLEKIGGIYGYHNRG